MNTSENHVDIGGYVAGELSAAHAEAVDAHLETCEPCREEVESLREIKEFLGALPPEALLDGPPENADLLLRRTLRQVRSEASSVRTRNRSLAAAAAVVVAAAGLGIGVLVGRSGQDSGTPVALPPPATSSPTTEVPGTRFASGTDPATGARLTVGVVPAAGWVKVNASVMGIPAGQRCRLIVVAKDGSRQVAGNWLVSAQAAQEGVNLDGSALIDPADVASVVVENTDGHQFVHVEI
jgi:Putative zinc-finger